MDSVICMECFALVQSRHVSYHRNYHRSMFRALYAASGLLEGGESDMLSSEKADTILFRPSNHVV